jgi:hypothetical protein
MADIGIPKNYLVVPTKEIDEMWIQVQIQEKKSMIARKNQDIEDLKKGRILDLEAQIKLHELEIKSLEARLKQSKASIEARAL